MLNVPQWSMILRFVTALMIFLIGVQFLFNRQPVAIVGEGKVEGVKSLLPDAIFCEWEKFRGALKRAIAEPPENPVVPSSVFAGYSGTPLPKKLGIKPGEQLTLVVPASRRMGSEQAARFEQLYLSGIVHTGTELDQGVALVDLSLASSVTGMDEAISGLRLNKPL